MDTTAPHDDDNDGGGVTSSPYDNEESGRQPITFVTTKTKTMQHEEDADSHNNDDEDDDDDDGHEEGEKDNKVMMEDDNDEDDKRDNESGNNKHSSMSAGIGNDVDISIINTNKVDIARSCHKTVALPPYPGFVFNSIGEAALALLHLVDGNAAPLNMIYSFAWRYGYILPPRGCSYDPKTAPHHPLVSTSASASPFKT
eukprot:TRINITY_DN3276_c0_g1_i5.p1 TRINITY_DN3276_c0_g1~~TRINITY_DN3276_c0_g1_i5.p1  ORF type:complete len:199 (-),score=57.61 TRINITY_DN3276_c0_g1_i5:54-650(-)